MTPNRSSADLEAAAFQVTREWTTLAEQAALLEKVTGHREPQEQAILESCFLHLRCLINFLSGNYQGVRSGKDIQPIDFLGREWWLDDDELDCRLRGRLAVINKELAHLSWERINNDVAIMWPMSLLVHEVCYGMKGFVNELCDGGGSCLVQFEAACQQVDAVLPPLGQVVAALPPLAPSRRASCD